MMNYIKRRFSTDLLDADEDSAIAEHGGNDSNRSRPTSLSQQNVNRSAISQRRTTSIGPSPSAPSSPTKSISSLSAMLSTAKEMIISTNSSNTNNNATLNQSKQLLTRQATLSKDRAKILLVIDDSNVDWSKYFKKLGDFDLRVEQADFKSMNLAAYSESGTTVDLLVDKDGVKVMRSFRPDFVLVRQNVRDSIHDWKDMIIGLEFGCIPSINSLQSVYNFRDKPWVMRTQFPCVVKIGHAHQGVGKIKVLDAHDFQEIVSIVSMSNTYATIEPFVQTKCDIIIQKIGRNYKAYTRKSITGSWKANLGSAMLEQIQMQNRYRLWIDEISKLFDGMDMCAVQVIVEAETNRELIIDVADCALNLMGESQEADRLLIADLVLEKMHNKLCSASQQTSQPQAVEVLTPIADSSNSSLSESKKDDNNASKSANNLNNNTYNEADSKKHFSNQSMDHISSSLNRETPRVPPRPVAAPQNRPPPPLPAQKNTNINNANTSKSAATTSADDSEDTMNNLRKTFAGIFGNSNI